jgi:S-adenosylmethionine:tRNA ribosyltransferase-isomerase
MASEIKNELYDYVLPEELIASKPAEPRDSARLLVFDTRSGEISFDTFSNLDKYIPKEAVLVLNDTRVVPARLTLLKSTGGKVEVLLLLNEWLGGNEPIRAMIDRKVQVGDKLFIGINDEKNFEVVSQNTHFFELRPNFGRDVLEQVLEKQGKTPIPKYIKGINLSETELRERYQSVFAAKPASVAAPTASLHFTAEVFAKLQKKGVERAFVSLHVGLGTFAPISDDNFKRNKLHEERLEIGKLSADKISLSKKEGKAVIAVGTTVVRSLESAASDILKSQGTGRSVTDIFIHPPYDFKIVDNLITNFHLPNSSLMMLVEAFLEFKGSRRHLVDLYREAIKEKMRFYSFGDVMYIK